MTSEEARKTISDGRGSRFDPVVTDALLTNFETALLLRNADGQVSDAKLARFVETPLRPRSALRDRPRRGTRA